MSSELNANPHGGAGDTFRELGREPCPVCRHGGRCKSNANRDMILCFRETAESAGGFRLIKQTGECAAYVRVGSSTDHRNASSSKSDWGRKADNYTAALSEDRALAQQLHVTPAALKRVGAGWSRRLHAFTFPEHDAQGCVIGISTRRPSDGAKKTIRGSKRGLIVPSELDATQPLLIVEGASDTAAALTVGLQAVGRPSARGGVAHLCDLLSDWTADIIVVGEHDQKPDGSWPGRDGALSVCMSLACRLGRPLPWAMPPDGVKDLRTWVQHEAPDLSDAGACEAAGRRILAALRDGCETVTEDDAGVESAGDGTQRGPSQSTLLVELARTKVLELFHDGDIGYATIPVGDHVESWPTKSTGFRRWLAREFYREHGRTPSSQPLQDAIGVLEGEGLYGGPEHKVFVRVGHANGAIYLDLCDAEWRIVEVTGGDWRTIAVPQAPVRFRRSRGMLALPEPARGGSLDELHRFVNIRGDADFLLCCAWLIGALQPRGPYPLLVLNGEQGSAKTFACRVLRRLIDPNLADVRSQPRDERDLVIAGNNGWVIALDNLSRVPPSLSDALCRIATGGGFATRALWTDADEMIFAIQRPTIVNGIEELVTRPDLLDRAILVTLPSIAEFDRRDEVELWADFDAASPRLLGALLTAVSAALQERGNVRLDRLPRMADFAKWVVAAENGDGVPWPAGQFLAAYTGNRAAAVDAAIEASAIGPALMARFAGQQAWTGTATELLAELETVADDRAKRAKAWPKTGEGMSGALRRLAPCLREKGIETTWNERTACARTLHLERVAQQPSRPSQPSSSPAGSPKNADWRGSTATVDDGCVDVDRHSKTPLCAQENAECDGDDGDDGLLHTQSGGQGGYTPDLGHLDNWGDV